MVFIYRPGWPDDRYNQREKIQKNQKLTLIVVPHPVTLL
jgi:hypothetical protein